MLMVSNKNECCLGECNRSYKDASMHENVVYFVVYENGKERTRFICGTCCQNSHDPAIRDYIRCRRCGIYALGDSCYEEVCLKCAGEWMERCRACNEYFLVWKIDFKNDGTWTTTRTVHCGKKCEGCKNDTYKNKVFTSGKECLGCCREPYHIRGHNFKPNFTRPVSVVKSVYSTRPTLGLEVEVHTNNNPLDSQVTMTEISRLNQFKRMFFKHDGSIMPGFELVTYPFVYEHLVSDRNGLWEVLNQINKRIDDKTFNKHPACGIHIHMSKKHFSRIQIMKILQFIKKEYKLVSFIARRRFDEVMGVKPYCKVARDNYTISAMTKYNADRYVAFNLKNKETVEFRIFKSSLDKHVVLSYIEFCFALWLWTKNSGMKDTAIDFMKFIRKERKQFLHLATRVNEYISSNKIRI